MKRLELAFVVRSVAPALACFVLTMAACTSDSDEPLVAVKAPAPASTPDFPAMFARLLSRQSNVRMEAFQGFREHWRPARSFVVEQTQAADAARRTAATYLLAQLGAPEDLPQLRRLLSSETESVRLMALRGIDRLHDAASAPTLAERVDKAAFDESCQLLSVLARLKPAAAEAACARLVTDEDWAKRKAGTMTLGELESASSGRLLLARLDDAVWLVQAEAVRAVGRRLLMAARPRLLELLKAENDQVRTVATGALGRLKQQGDLAALEAMTRTDPEEDVRIAAIEALANFPEASILPALNARLVAADEEEEVREAAMRTLAGLESAQAKAKLAALLEADAGLRTLAEKVLRKQRKPGNPDSATPPR